MDLNNERRSMNKRTGSRSRYWFTSPAERKILEKDKDITGEKYADMILSDMTERDLRCPYLVFCEKV